MISIEQGKFYQWAVEIKDFVFQGKSVFSNTTTVATVDFRT